MDIHCLDPKFLQMSAENLDFKIFLHGHFILRKFKATKKLSFFFSSLQIFQTYPFSPYEQVGLNLFAEETVFQSTT